MGRADDDEFRVRPGPPRSSHRGGERFVAQVRRQVSKAGAQAVGKRAGGRQFGRGRVAASLRTATSPHMRRVVIKARFVKVQPGSQALAQHLRYIERDGVTREGERGQAYGPDTGEADVRAFTERSQGDRHQFRFIVSAEDAAELGELRDFTRTLMRKMETDLETRLDWVAVDHHDTDNPHTHIVLRGRADNGQDLVIAPDYLAHGMRGRASEIVTRWLGLRTEREIAESLQREVEQERFTTLDRTLLRQAEVDVVDVDHLRGDMAYQRLLRARLQHLAGMGLAQPMDAGHWRLDGQMETTLRRLGERGDIVRTLHRAMRGEAREFVIDAGSVLAQPIVGRIVGKGLTDELHDAGYLVVDGVDGRAHYVALPPKADLADYPAGGIVEVRPMAESAADCNIAGLAREGLYRTADHLAAVRGRDSSPDMIVQSHVRRLEALRRAGIVERVEDGVWKVPADLLARGRAYDLAHRHGVEAVVQSYVPLAQQIASPGATWLDRQLIDGGAALAQAGFGAQARQAMQERAAHLEGEGLVQRRGGRVVLARGLLRTLRGRELAAVGKALQAETGLVYRPLGEDGKASGVYQRSLMLASGRFAMLDDGLGFSLVPWRPVIEPRLGQSMAATLQTGRVTWEFGRTKGIGL
ncbi:MAG: conjugal transfer protein [Bordetella sp. SCN 68-11]|nr:relaxase/mobilization nuclease and DUF3363 domain-containing protein [Burkholderiales bacterium]ODU68894.1 MAG: conjugal transfer protein [Bordetella sp. SCN 68-11]OJW94526.1 MAG: conjugal transfer protein [Burkholderiales bacterium 67-32]